MAVTHSSSAQWFTPDEAEQLLAENPDADLLANAADVAFIAHRMTHPGAEGAAHWRIELDRLGRLLAGRAVLLAVIRCRRAVFLGVWCTYGVLADANGTVPHRWDGERWTCLRCGHVELGPCSCSCHTNYSDQEGHLSP